MSLKHAVFEFLRIIRVGQNLGGVTFWFRFRSNHTHNSDIRPSSYSIRLLFSICYRFGVTKITLMHSVPLILLWFIYQNVSNN
jgi:hypothetical protein